MKRSIEALIEKRKDHRKRFQNTIEEIARLLKGRGIFKSGKPEIREKLSELVSHLDEWMTSQDKEWDAYSNNHATMVYQSLQWKIEKLEAEYSNVKTLLINFVNLEKSLQGIIDKAESGLDPTERQQLNDIKEKLSPFQYSDFEHRFRGDEATIQENLKAYLQHFTHTDHILDLGCGRGEFLELLQNKGKHAEGIDISESMLARARQKGLNCIRQDILTALKQKPDQSVGGIFSSQVIEHFRPKYLREVVLECFRVLKPRAPVILETINPLSLFALSRIFFLDVTHQMPLHPEYMRYLLENSGFSQVDIFYSAELVDEKLETIPPDNALAQPFNTNVDKLNQILFASPAYAVKGIK
jgi:O-antigen chain-terminating methyltransferase